MLYPLSYKGGGRSDHLVRSIRYPVVELPTVVPVRGAHPEFMPDSSLEDVSSQHYVHP
jgi:hypothetical protein